MTPGGEGCAGASGGLAARLKRIADLGAVEALRGKDGLHPSRAKHAPGKAPRGWKELGDFSWSRRTTVKASFPALLDPSPLLPSGGDPASLVYFDIETTGLSGGAGTIAFLIGLGSSDGESLTIDQFFLSDYPGEFDFLGFVLARVDETKTYVSYNGKAFDTQILRTRCIMTGRSFPAFRQLDLLYPVRKLWGNSLPSCSLGTVEEQILGIRREIDVPGMLVPDLYFEFLKTGETGGLKRVFAHHLQDIVTLERLTCHLARVLANPEIDSLLSKCRLGRWLVDSGYAHGIDVLTEAFEEGDIGAGYYLGRYLKKAGRYEQAAAVWTTMFERVSDLNAAFELVKYAEHKLRDFSLAEELASRILAAAKRSALLRTPEPVERLEYRLGRIRRKARRV